MEKELPSSGLNFGFVMSATFSVPAGTLYLT